MRRRVIGLRFVHLLLGESVRQLASRAALIEAEINMLPRFHRRSGAVMLDAIAVFWCRGTATLGDPLNFKVLSAQVRGRIWPCAPIPSRTVAP